MKINFYHTAFALLLIFLVGCGSNVTVSGTVKFADGTPLDRGTVTFEDAKMMAYGDIQKNGTYSLDSGEAKGIPPGTYRVSITGLNAPIVIPPTEIGGKVQIIPQVSPIHKRFENPAASGLTCEVKGRTKFDITVEPPQ